MGALDKLADKLYGKKRLEVTASLTSVATDTYIGTAVSDSEDGSVQVIVSDDVTQPDHWQEFVTYGNLSPFLSHDLTDYGVESSDAYWNSSQEVVAALGSATQAEDGWAHFAGTASDMALAVNAAQLEVEDGQEYTLLVELRNIVQAPNGSAAISLGASASDKIHGDGDEHPYSDGAIRILGVGNASASSGLSLSMCSGNSAEYDFDMRLSLYTGTYDGGYFPYGEQEITQADLGTAISIPSTVAVKAGDKVLVTASGAEVITPMVVTGVVGRGDQQQAEIDGAVEEAAAAAADAADARSIADAALDVAEATGQYFWHNTGEETDPIEADVSGGTGAHVTQFKREEWSDPTHENYHKGPNSLWNSLGMLFRNGLNNLMALLAGRTDATTTFAGAQSEYGYGRYAMPMNTRTVTSVLADGVAAAFTLNRYGAYVELEVTAPAATSEIEVSYTTDSAVGFFFGGETTAEIGPNGMTLARDFDGTSGSASIDFFEGRGRVYATADGAAGDTGASQGITIDTGVQAATQSASVSARSGDSGAWVTITTNHNDQRYLFPVLRVGQSESADEIYMKASTLSLDYGSSNPTGGPFGFDMLEVINSIRTASTTMQLTNVGSGTHTLDFYRQGRFVFASMANAINPSSANTAINAGTVPSGFRPAKTAFCSGAGMVSNTISNWFYRWRVATTGAITLHISVTGAREAPISMAWFTNDDWPS